jgi:hypothetical protein
MPPVSQRVPDLLGGVSQQAPHRRKPNELEESLNALHSAARGFGKRPPTEHVGLLSSSAATYSGAKIIPLDYGTAQRFFAAIVNGDLRVWDDEGVAQNVQFPHGKEYLNTPGSLSFQQYDDFTDTNGTDLGAYTSPFGVQWIQTHGTADRVQIQNNMVEQLYNASTAGTEQIYRLDSTLPSADYTITYRTKNKGGSLGNHVAGLNFKLNNNDTTDRSGYRLRVVYGSTVFINVYRMNTDGSIFSQLMQYTGASSADELLDWQTVGIRITGNFMEILYNGAVVASVSDPTYNSDLDRTANGLWFNVPSTFDRQALIDDLRIEWEEALPSDALGVIRTATAGRRTFIANRNRKVLRDTTSKSPVQTPQALLYIESADFSTKYEVTLDGTTISYETPAGADAGARRLISTDSIADGIIDLLRANFATYTFQQYGSMIHLYRNDDGDFQIATKDGLADNGLRAIKGSVQRSADLPLRCVEGFVIEVIGDPEEAKDNYWVKFNTQGNDDFRGVWEECSRPGEGNAFDATTMPHELVFSNKLTPEMVSASLPPRPVVGLSFPLKDEEQWSNTLNGSDLSGFQLPWLRDHGDDLYVNFEDTNGGPIRFGTRYNVNTTKIPSTESVTVVFEHNDGAASSTWTQFSSLTFPPGIYLKDQFHEADISTNIGVNWDVRVRLEYGSGATPADDDDRAVIFFDFRPYYYNYTSRTVTWNSLQSYPSGTVWEVTVDATTVTYTQTADMTGDEIATAIDPLVEAIAGVACSLQDYKAGGKLLAISLDAGGLPTVSVSMSFSNDTTFWNPDIDLGYADDALVGYTLRNLSDGSSGTITANTSTQIVVDAFTGGVENAIRNGDRMVVEQDSDTFVFRRVDWAEREAGDTHTNPWPSFVDDYIRDVFFHRGRLGFLASGNITFSEAGVPDNLWRTVTTDVLDSDPIDVSWSGGGNTRFHSAVPWNGDMVCFGDTVQVVPRADGVLSPKTVRLDLLAAYPCDDTLRPEPAGRWVFFGRRVGEQIRVQAMGISPRTRVAEAVNVSPDLTSYLSGSPLFMAGDSDLGHLFLVTDGDQSTLYHLKYTMGDDQPPAYSWGKWTFAGDILGMVVNEGVISLVMSYSDGIYLETLNLSENY